MNVKKLENYQFSLEEENEAVEALKAIENNKSVSQKHVHGDASETGLIRFV